jgi:excisionase family DNA binding protein
MGCTTFDDFMVELEAEAQVQGIGAVDELENFRRHFSDCFGYFEYGGTVPDVARTTRSIGAGTAVAVAPQEALDMERDALSALDGVADDAFIEVEIKASRETRAVFPVGLLRRYLAAQSVPGRRVLLFDSDEEISSEVAASMLGVSRPYLNELLDVEAIPYRRVGNQRRIRVVDLNAYRGRRDAGQVAIRELMDVQNEAGGWTR